MTFRHAVILLAAATLPAAFAQFVSPPTDLQTAEGYAGINVRYKEVPVGICELDPNVKSYSGYADVGENEHIFWWFFEARDVDPKEAPLTTWINGGPGASSMIGLFQENGPCGIDASGKVVNNPYSWSKYSNMLYIDQPATVGMSYTIPIHAYRDTKSGKVIPINGTGCPTNLTGQCGTLSSPDESLVPNSTATAAPNFWKTLQGFMGAFPQYSRNGFHFSTESYGGHYGPVFNEYIEEQNAHLPEGAHKVQLESVLIGNGWYDPIIQYPAYYNFTVFPGNTYDYRPYNKSTEEQLYDAVYGKGQCVDQLKHCAATKDNEICSKADQFCAVNVESIYDEVLNRDEYDMRELESDPFPYWYFYAYLNTAEVQKAIGAYQNFTEGSTTVGDAFDKTGDDGRRDNIVADMQELLKQGITVMMYTGDADYNCNWLGGQAVSLRVNAPGFSSAGYAGIQTSDGVCHGEVKQSGKFSFVRIYESGHEVPFYQPLAALEIFQRAITGKDIATGGQVAGDGYATKGPAESTYRQGNGTMQFRVTPPGSTYNTTTNKPDPPPSR